MSALGLRLLACLLMLLDHIGFHTGWLVLRAAGRLSFPIFAFLIANGARHTHSLRRYALRLGLLMLLSQIPYSLCFSGAVYTARGNIFVTLLLGLGCIAAWRRSQGAGLAVLLGCAVLNCFFSFDYEWPGVVLIVLFSLCPLSCGRNRAMAAVGMVLCLCWPLLDAGPRSSLDWLRPLALLALPLLCTYRGRSGTASLTSGARRALQWACYLFYPAHLLLLWMIFL